MSDTSGTPADVADHRRAYLEELAGETGPAYATEPDERPGD